MQTVESFGLRGMVDLARADRVDAHRHALADEVRSLRTAAEAGKRMVPAAPKPPGKPPKRDATRTQGRRRAGLPPAPASAIERRRLPDGLYRLPDGGTLAVGAAVCAAQLRELKTRRAETAEAALVETATKRWF